jgi:hypothetical protein
VGNIAPKSENASIPAGVLVLTGSLAPKLFKIRTYEKRARNPSGICTSKTRDLKSFRIRTYRKTGGGARGAAVQTRATRALGSGHGVSNQAPIPSNKEYWSPAAKEQSKTSLRIPRCDSKPERSRLPSSPKDSSTTVLLTLGVLNSILSG